MKNRDKIMMAAGLAAGVVAFVMARRRSRPEKEEYTFFKKSRHLTPVFAKVNKHS
jgi:hypothetical protein